MMRRPSKRAQDGSQHRMLPRWLQITTITVLSLFGLLPVVAMVLVSVMPDAEAAAGRLIPSEFLFSNYVSMWETIDLAPGLINSVIASLASSAVSTLLALGTAYVLVRFVFRGRGLLLQSMLGLQSVPSTLLLLPLFIVFFLIEGYVGVTLIGSRAGLIATYLTLTLPFSTWIMITYIRSLPVDLEEAGLVDGLTRVGVLFRIVLPLAWPGMVVAGIFSFLLGWNDVLFASVLTGPDTGTAAIALNAFSQAQEGGAIPKYGQLMAGSVVSAVPVVALYLFFQRYLSAGLTAGGVKG